MGGGREGSKTLQGDTKPQGGKTLEEDKTLKGDKTLEDLDKAQRFWQLLWCWCKTCSSWCRAKPFSSWCGARPSPFKPDINKPQPETLPSPACCASTVPSALVQGLGF